MKSYVNGGLQGYNSTTNNYGTRIISNTRIVSPGSTNLENVRFTFASGVAFAFEVTWYEFNLFNNSTQWTWWGDHGGYVDASGNFNYRFGQTVRQQAGTNNGTGVFTSSANALWWISRTFTPSQNISSVYFLVHCDRWDKVTVTYS